MSNANSSRAGDVFWSGAPDPNALLNGWDAFWIPFGIAWITFAVTVTTTAPSGLPTIAGAAAIIIGIYIAAGRLLAKRWAKRRTTYQLTGASATIRGPRHTHSVDLSGPEAMAQITASGGRIRARFTSSNPRLSSLSIFRTAFANTGLDFTLTPGRDIPFEFFDVRDASGLTDALERVRLHNPQLAVEVR
ncbi:UNVERIFIED_CONTAM: hypothetical protein OHV15_08295 [Microbacterium sp. SLM126]